MAPPRRAREITLAALCRVIATDARAASRIIKAHREIASEKLLAGATRQDTATNFIAAAVKALLDRGADPRRRNGSGSTPAQLATLTTGRGGTGSSEAKAQQAEIIRFLAANR